MQSQGPLLLPLLRSRVQAQILTLILLPPHREWSLSELADRVGSAVSTVQREVARAEQAGIIASRRLGNTRLVSAATSPLTGPLTDLLLRSFGPPQVIAEEFSDIRGIDGLYVYGSWAARYQGVAGRPPADVDVLVIGSPDRDELDEAVGRATTRLGREVTTTIRSADWWLHGADGFHTEVTERPIVPVIAYPADRGKA